MKASCRFSYSSSAITATTVTYDEAAKRIRGDKAKLNFPASHHHPPPPPVSPQLSSTTTPPAKNRRTTTASAAPENFEPAALSPPQLEQEQFVGDFVYDNNGGGYEFEFKDEIAGLESFLGLDHMEPETAAATELIGSSSGGSSESPVDDLWMLDDLVTHHQHQCLCSIV